MNSQWSLGIDFGTSNTAAAHTNPVKGDVETVSLNHNSSTMSSAVYFESADAVDVGDVALNKAESNPSGFIPAPKRLISQHIFQVNGYEVNSSVPVAAILKSVLARASREHDSTPPAELVLTHPQAWSENELKVLLEAAASLGLGATSIKTVSEPQAAAHYYSEAKRLEPGDRIAVFDFGGGTLDTAVLEAQADGSFSVIAARGENTLGGKSFDAMVRRWVDLQLEEDDPELLSYLRTEASVSDRHAVEDSIRRAKELLSEASRATIVIRAGHKNRKIQITREELEEIISPVVDRAVEITKATLRDAQIFSKEDLQSLYLTGGSSRIPLVQEQLKELGPLSTLDDPKTVVARGALRAAGPILTGLNAPLVDTSESPTQAESLHTRTEEAQEEENSGDTKEFQQLEPTSHSQPLSRSKIRNFSVLIVLVVLSIGALVWGISRNDEESESAAVPSSASSAANTASESLKPEVESEPVEGVATPVKDVLDQAPKSLADGVTDCSISDGGLLGWAEYGIQCQVDMEGSLKDYFLESQYDNPSIYIASDKKAAKSQRASIRDGHVGSPNFEQKTWKEGDTRVLAGVNKASSVRDGVALEYADPQSGLVVSVLEDLQDSNSAERFLREVLKMKTQEAQNES